MIEVRLYLYGIAVTLLDTAGIRDTDDLVEGLGVQRAKERATQADIRVHMLMPDSPIPLDIGVSDILVHAKSDLWSPVGLGVSGHTGAGIDALVDQISSILKERVGSVGIAMRERHRIAMVRAIGYMDVAEADLSSETGMTDLIAEELRSAIRAVDSLVGRVDVEQVLDEIFSSFCIGK